MNLQFDLIEILYFITLQAKQQTIYQMIFFTMNKFTLAE